MRATPFIAITSDFNAVRTYGFRIHISWLESLVSTVVNCVFRLRH